MYYRLILAAVALIIAMGFFYIELEHQKQMETLDEIIKIQNRTLEFLKKWNEENK